MGAGTIHPSSDGGQQVDNARHVIPTIHTLECCECGALSPEEPVAVGWRACRCDDPEVEEEPALAFYCPACAVREFGAPSER